MRNLSRAENIQLISMLEEQARRKQVYRYKTMYDTLYDWQLEFISTTKAYMASCLCAANRIGKTYTGTYIDAIHLMGDYPEEWAGHRFEGPVKMWLLGYSGEKTRDLLQQELFGRMAVTVIVAPLAPLVGVNFTKLVIA